MRGASNRLEFGTEAYAPIRGKRMRLCAVLKIIANVLWNQVYSAMF